MGSDLERSSAKTKRRVSCASNVESNFCKELLEVGKCRLEAIWKSIDWLIERVMEKQRASALVQVRISLGGCLINFITASSVDFPRVFITVGISFTEPGCTSENSRD